MPMDRATPEEKTEAHNKGEKDVAEVSGHNHPHGRLESNFSAAAGAFQKENEAYDKGYENGRKQRG
jgi:hypothetical protein